MGPTAGLEALTKTEIPVPAGIKPRAFDVPPFSCCNDVTLKRCTLYSSYKPTKQTDVELRSGEQEDKTRSASIHMWDAPS